MEKLFETISLINAPTIQNILGPLRFLPGVIGIGFFLFAAFVLVRTSWLGHAVIFDLTELLTYRPYGLRRMAGKWQKVLSRLETANEAEYKLAVIETDSLLNDILLRMGFRGETLGDRLKNLTPAIIPNLHDVTRAHQTRNNVVHDPDYRLSLDETRKTLEIYEAAFRNLDLI
jgi:hypothetical protein